MTPAGPPPDPDVPAPGSAAIRPDDARTFVGRVDALEQGVAQAREALRRLGEEPLPVGTGQDNTAIAGWYRALVTADTVPAAQGLAADLDGVRRAVRDSVAEWEQTDRGAAGSFRPDPGTG